MTYKKRGKRMVSDEFIAKTMERLAALGGICQLHCENGDILCYLEDKAIAEGRTAPTDFPPTCPDWTEEEAINRAVLIARLTGCPVYVVPLSTKVGLERIKRAQAEGQKVWTETCPQYLLLTDKEMERWGPFAKIGPPLRPAEGPDRAALWEGSAAGAIATVASDHAPRVRRPRNRGGRTSSWTPRASRSRSARRRSRLSCRSPTARASSSGDSPSRGSHACSRRIRRASSVSTRRKA